MENGNVLYFKKVIQPNPEELKSHEEFLKKNLKKIFLIKSFIIKLLKSIFFSNLIVGCPELCIKLRKEFSKSG